MWQLLFLIELVLTLPAVAEKKKKKKKCWNVSEKQNKTH